jgi:hypothetical protein
MKEKERIKLMDDIVGMQNAERAKHEKELNDVEATVQKEKAEESAKLHEFDEKILEEQDRQGVFDNQQKLEK